jgi:hypothetical protein
MNVRTLAASVKQLKQPANAVVFAILQSVILRSRLVVRKRDSLYIRAPHDRGESLLLELVQDGNLNLCNQDCHIRFKNSAYGTSPNNPDSDGGGGQDGSARLDGLPASIGIKLNPNVMDAGYDSHAFRPRCNPSAMAALVNLPTHHRWIMKSQESPFSTYDRTSDTKMLEPLKVTLPWQTAGSELIYRPSAMGRALCFGSGLARWRMARNYARKLETSSIVTDWHSDQMKSEFGAIPSSQTNIVAALDEDREVALPNYCPRSRMRDFIARHRGSIGHVGHDLIERLDVTPAGAGFDVVGSLPGPELGGEVESNYRVEENLLALGCGAGLSRQVIRNLCFDLGHVDCLSRFKNSDGRNTCTPNSAARATAICRTLCVTRYRTPVSRASCTSASSSGSAATGGHAVLFWRRSANAQSTSGNASASAWFRFSARASRRRIS